MARSSRRARQPAKKAAAPRGSKARPARKSAGSNGQKGQPRAGRRSGITGLDAAVAARFVAVVAAVVLGVVFGPRVIGVASQAGEEIIRALGLGVILLAIVVGVLIWLIVAGFRPLVRRWHRFVGGALLGLGLWGFLALFRPAGGIFYSVTLGGQVGKAILGTPDVMGAVRVSALFIAGLILLAPGPLMRLSVWLFRPRPKTVTGYAVPRRTYSPEPAERSFLRNDSAPRKEAPPAAAPAATKASAELSSPDAPRRGFPFGKRETESVPPAALAAAATPATAAGIEPSREPIVTLGGWQIPPVDILEKPRELELDREEVDKRARLIEEALDSYGVEGRVAQINTGPTVTQFGVEPGWLRKYRKVTDDNGAERQEEVSRTRIRVDRITSLANDLALALAAPSIRIEAPIPGKSMVGIEVPNSAFGSVALRSVIESTTFQKLHAKTKLALALGKGAGGESVAGDLTRMPHLLIAGATGSGKTVCLDSIICCLLMHNSPDDLRVLLVDPKRVELVSFSEIPHLAAPVVVDTDRAVKVLRWLNAEMDRRYREFAKAKARNIEGYNKDRSPGEAMPYLVLVIDELADLMMAAFDEVEHTLCRLAQLARATGIHLIVATQRPSVDVVTGLIKANFPTRISFAVTSQVDSRTILDTVGAEKLLGRGDMLYLPSEAGRPKRLQGTYVSDAEMEKLVQFWASQRRQEGALISPEELESEGGPGQRTPIADPMLEEARKLAAEHQQISASFLQRKLRIGYPRAARIMEQLELETPEEGSPAQEEPPF
jgi:S-DNA-T family DNA segregation ATPase FtsK/SpoIIIE